MKDWTLLNCERVIAETLLRCVKCSNVITEALGGAENRHRQTC